MAGRGWSKPDRTKLGKELHELEKDPEIKRARKRVDEAMDKWLHPEDYVNPDNLRVDEPDERGVIGGGE